MQPSFLGCLVIHHRLYIVLPLRSVYFIHCESFAQRLGGVTDNSTSCVIRRQFELNTNVKTMWKLEVGCAASREIIPPPYMWSNVWILVTDKPQSVHEALRLLRRAIFNLFPPGTRAWGFDEWNHRSKYYFWVFAFASLWIRPETTPSDPPVWSYSGGNILMSLLCDRHPSHPHWVTYLAH